MWRIYALLSLVTLIAGLTPIAARMATAELPPLSLAFFRFALAGIMLAITGRFLGLKYNFTQAQWPVLLGLGALCVPINQIGFLVGIQRANASHAGIAYALVPVLVYWIALWLKRASFSVGMVAASTLAFAGAAAVVLCTAAPASSPRGIPGSMILGDSLLLSAAVSWALFTVLSQPVVRRFGPIQTLAAVFLIGSTLQLPLLIVDYCWFDLGSFELARVTWRGVAGFTFITIITAYTNYLLWYFVIAKYDVARSSVVVNASFLLTVLIEAVFFGLLLSWWIAVGSVLLFGGVALAARTRERPSAQSESTR